MKEFRLPTKDELLNNLSVIRSAYETIDRKGAQLSEAEAELRHAQEQVRIHQDQFGGAKILLLIAAAAAIGAIPISFLYMLYPQYPMFLLFPVVAVAGAFGFRSWYRKNRSSNIVKTNQRIVKSKEKEVSDLVQDIYHKGKLAETILMAMTRGTTDPIFLDELKTNGIPVECYSIIGLDCMHAMIQEDDAFPLSDAVFKYRHYKDCIFLSSDEDAEKLSKEVKEDELKTQVRRGIYKHCVAVAEGKPFSTDSKGTKTTKAKDKGTKNEPKTDQKQIQKSDPHSISTQTPPNTPKPPQTASKQPKYPEVVSRPIHPINHNDIILKQTEDPRMTGPSSKTAVSQTIKSVQTTEKPVLGKTADQIQKTNDPKSTPLQNTKTKKEEPIKPPIKEKKFTAPTETMNTAQFAIPSRAVSNIDEIDSAVARINEEEEKERQHKEDHPITADAPIELPDFQIPDFKAQPKRKPNNASKNDPRKRNLDSKNIKQDQQKPKSESAKNNEKAKQPQKNPASKPQDTKKQPDARVARNNESVNQGNKPPKPAQPSSDFSVPFDMGFLSTEQQKLTTESSSLMSQPTQNKAVSNQNQEPSTDDSKSETTHNTNPPKQNKKPYYYNKKKKGGNKQ